MQARNPELKLIIGLGNPNKRYANTYHNAGRLFIDYAAERGDVSVKLVKSIGYMNESGVFVKKTLKK